MRGRYKVRVRNSRNAYEFELKRNITVLRGDSGRGKTSLFNFASGAHERVGNYSGVTVDAKEGFTDFEDYRLRLVDQRSL